MTTAKLWSRKSGSRAVAAVSALLTALAMMVLVPSPARAEAVTITSFSPLAGTPTTSLVITGTGLDTAAGVSIGGHSARFVINSATSITATVGYNDATGLVRVSDGSGSVLAVSSRSFTVLPGVVPSTAKPAPNSPFTLSGAGFGRSEQVIVSIGGTEVSSAFTTDGPFVDNFTMPGNLVPGTYQVTAVGHDSTATASTTIYIFDNWANPSGGPNSSGANDNEIVLGAGNVTGLHETWAKYLNSVSGNTLAVADGTAYIATSLVGNTGTSILYAWPERGGTLRWQFALPGKQMRGPVYANNVVYVAAYQPETSTQPVATTYYALNAKTGAVIWTRSVTNAYAGVMVVSDGMLFATLFSSPGNLLITMRTSDGSTAWSRTFGNVIFGPSVSGGRVFVASSNANAGDATGSIVAMQEFSGNDAWSTAVAPGEFTQPVVSGGRVYYSVISSTGATVLRSADAATGVTVWSHALVQHLWAQPTINAGVVYVSSNQADNIAFTAGLDVATGNEMWRHLWPAGVGVQSMVAAANGIAFAPGDNGVIYALSSSGTLLMQLTPGFASANVDLAIADGRLYESSANDRHIHGYGLTS